MYNQYEKCQLINFNPTELSRIGNQYFNSHQRAIRNDYHNHCSEKPLVNLTSAETDNYLHSISIAASLLDNIDVYS